jgi:spermidine/putrescine transport system substrate-binding protein
MTGIAWNEDVTGPVTSMQQLLEDPKLKGKVTLLQELADSVGLVMLQAGDDPGSVTDDTFNNAIATVQKAVDSGQIRRFTGNDYTRDMANGDVAALIGWSGDAIQLQADNPAIEFRMPTDGCVLFSDNMVIPVGAPNPTAAEAFANYVYDPENQAQIADYNYYVTPVDGVKEILEKQGSPAAKSELVFPTEEFTKDCVNEPELTGEEEQRVTRAFEGVLTR